MPASVARKQPRQAQSGHWLLGATGALCFGLVLWLTAPGYMASDSGDQLSQARAGEYFDAQPVLMALVWHYLDQVVPGPLGMLVLTSALHVGAATLLAASMPGRVVWRALGLVGFCFYPPVFSNLPVVWKDTLMQGGLVAGLACFVRFLERPAAPKARAARAADAAWLGAGLLLCSLGIGARHNAPAAAAPLLGLPVLALPALRRWRQRLVALLTAAAAGVVGAGVLMLALGKALGPISHREQFWQVLPVFDLAGMSLETGELLVEPESGLLTQGLGLSEIRRLYHPFYANSLYYCAQGQGRSCVPLFSRSDDAQRLALLRSNWLRAIARHPLAYLKTRGRMALALMGLRHGPPGNYYVQGFPHHELAAPHPPTARTRHILRWLDDHISAPWARPWPYVFLCLGLFPVALWRWIRGRGSALPVALAGSGLLCLLGLTISACSPDHRYMGWTILCGVLALATTWGYPPLDRERLDEAEGSPHPERPRGPAAPAARAPEAPEPST